MGFIWFFNKFLLCFVKEYICKSFNYYIVDYLLSFDVFLVSDDLSFVFCFFRFFLLFSFICFNSFSFLYIYVMKVNKVCIF